MPPRRIAAVATPGAGERVEPKYVGGSSALQAKVRAAIARYPAWFSRGARLSRVIISSRPDVREQVAMYEHGTRDLYVCPEVGDLLQKAIGHELAHGCDDNFGKPHFFTSTPEWQRIHREQSHFDIPKYRDQPLEYFADMVTKLFLLGPERMRTTNPAEVTFITSWVFPTLTKEFGS